MERRESRMSLLLVGWEDCSVEQDVIVDEQDVADAVCA